MRRLVSCRQTLPLAGCENRLNWNECPARELAQPRAPRSALVGRSHDDPVLRAVERSSEEGGGPAAVPARRDENDLADSQRARGRGTADGVPVRRACITVEEDPRRAAVPCAGHR